LQPFLEKNDNDLLYFEELIIIQVLIQVGIVTKNVLSHLPYLLLLLVLGCTATDRQPKHTATPDGLLVQGGPIISRRCLGLVWHDYNTNRYEYQFDARGQLSQCTAFEQTASPGLYALSQQLTYARNGLLEQVRGGGDSSRYHYKGEKLASIDFFQLGQLVYRYLVTTNQQNKITGLRGIPLNDSGLPASSTRYQLDEQGRYVQLEVADERGVLYARVTQSDFVAAKGHLNGALGTLPYNLNHDPWLSWGEEFPLSGYLARRIQQYRYAASETPTKLIQRADLLVSWQRDKQGYITAQFRSDALTTIQDTSLINHLNCH